MCNQINHLDQLVIYQLSIHSTMNPLSPDLDIILKDYSHQALLRLLSKVETQQEEKTVGIFNCTPNQQYIIKRLINACLSRQTEVKFNAYFSLSAFITRFSSVVSKLNSINLYQYITSQSKIKDCQGKTSQIQAYVTGKILTLKAFRQILKDNIEVINELIKLTQKFPQFEEQFIQLASLLATSKKSQLAFSKLSPNTKAGFVLFSILRANNKHQNFALTEAIINDVLAQLVPQYPKMSICISYLGAKLNQMENPGKYLQTLFQAAFGDQVDEFNFRKIYFALQLLQSHLKNTVITKQNVSNSITPGLVGVWLSQTKVQNKNIKKLASKIKLSIQDDKQLAFNILKELHNAKISLSNLNVRHPLYSVYEAVDADTYSQFLLELCSQDTSSIQTEQNSETVPIEQLQMFVVLFNKKIKAELLANVVQLFAARYKNKKQDVHLQALSAIFNSIFAFSNKKKNKINTRLAVILSKVNVDNLDLGQNLNEIKDSIKVIRKHVKEAKQDQGAFVNSFLNFQLALGLYFLMYPEEIELHSDLQCAYDDIKNTFLHKQQGLKPKKKRKVNPEQDKNKPIHVLVDILISLLTKSPQFLRSTINPLFQQLIPYVDSQDLSHLFEVIQRPDEEYIEDIQNE